MRSAHRLMLIPSFYWYFLTEIFFDFSHPFHLVYRERTSAVAVTALKTDGGIFFQGKVMLLCKNVPKSGKIIVFVHQTDVDSGRTWMTVFAVYAFSFGIIRGQRADDRIVSLCLSDHPIIFSIKIPYPFVGSLTNT